MHPFSDPYTLQLKFKICWLIRKLYPVCSFQLIFSSPKYLSLFSHLMNPPYCLAFFCSLSELPYWVLFESHFAFVSINFYYLFGINIPYSAFYLIPDHFLSGRDRKLRNRKKYVALPSPLIYLEFWRVSTIALIFSN